MSDELSEAVGQWMAAAQADWKREWEGFTY